MRSNGGFQNWEMIEVERYRALNKRHLEARERYWIDTLKPTLNSNMPITTDADKSKPPKKRKPSKTGYCDECDVKYKCNWKAHHTSTAHYLLSIVHKNHI